MPGSVDELIDLLDLEPIEANLFRGQQPDTLLQRVFGGQVLAQAIMAAIRTVSDAYLVHSLHSYFLRPGDPPCRSCTTWTHCAMAGPLPLVA